MGKRETRADALARAERAERESFAYGYVMRAVLRGDEPDFERTIGGVDLSGDNCSCYVRAWGIGRADGGYVLIMPFGGWPQADSLLAWTSRVTSGAALSEFAFQLQALGRSLYHAMSEAQKATG
jgi:hypothetical protein